MGEQEKTSLTKQDAIQLLREKHGLTVETSRDIVEDVVGAFVESIVRTGYLSVKGLGTFTVVKRAGRSVQHPSTQERMKIPTHNGVRFALAAVLKELVRKEGRLPAAGK
jgi:nucleoid DNA-binding protein